ncbi:MAG: Peptidase and chymotrypsin/Hap [Verrucomicrobiales bacterium]|nr:Peptidase and chymotrypsin/Hap [Verrucomicrobiales bacterium]
MGPYSDRMLLRQIFLALGTAASVAAVDTLQLKDQASISGKILTEKRDQVAIDVGYTVLVVPRNQITRIVTDEEAQKALQSAQKSKTAPPAGSSPPPTKPATTAKFFQSPAGPTQELTVRELVEHLGESVVQVRTPGGLGSGFIIHEDGYLITNFHVIEGETQISVEVYQQMKGQLDRHSYRQVRIIAMNKYADLALLKIEDKDAPKFARVVLGDSETLDVGERVFAIGSPLGLERTVTEGIISTKSREMQGDLYLQTTAQINPGNSGGPLFNLRGEVIGVTNMKITFGEGLGFAIPIEIVKFFLNHRDAYAYDNDNPSNPYRYLEPPSRVKKSVTTGQPPKS